MMKKSVLFIGVMMLALGLAIAGCGGTTTTTTTTTTTIPTFSIAGTVKFATTNDGVKGTTLISYTGAASGTTSANSATGTYEISGLSNGTYYFTATKEGWTASTETVVLTAAATQDFSITPASWEVYFIGSANLNRMTLASDGNRRHYFIAGDNGKAYGLSVTATSPLGIDWSSVKTIVTGSTTDNYKGASYLPGAPWFATWNDAGLIYQVTCESWDSWGPGTGALPSDWQLTNINSNGNYCYYNGNPVIYLIASGSLKYRNDPAYPSSWITVGGSGNSGLRDQSRFLSDSKLYMCGANGKLAVTTVTTESDPTTQGVVEISGFPTTEQLNGISTVGNNSASTAGHYNFIVTERGNIYVTTTPSTGSSWTTDPSSSASGTNALFGIPYALNAVLDTDFGTYVVGDNGLLMIHTN